MPLINSDVRIVVNNKTVEYYGNSGSYSLGIPVSDVKGMSAGGGTGTVAVGVDITSGVAFIKYKIPTNANSNKLVKEWTDNPEQNTVELIGKNGFNEVMLTATCISPGEGAMDSSEGGLEIEWRGPTMK